MENSSSARRKSSIWHYDPPTVFDKVTNYLTGLTKFRQSDFTTLSKAGAHCISLSLYPPEKGFFSPLKSTGTLADAIADLATGLGPLRIDHIQKYQSYWRDLLRVYDFVKQLDNRVYTIDKKRFAYRLVDSFADVEILRADETVHRIGVMLSIEGMHVLDCGLDKPADESTVLGHVDELKNLGHRFFFVTLAHHFYNELAGHARSLSKLIGTVLDQSEGINTGITPLGEKVISKLLSKDNGYRIPIDVKHMSLASRKAYYEILADEYADDPIPVIVTHGAVTGLNDWGGKETIPGASSRFNSDDINFFDFELVKISETRGIIGLQLDERRIGSEMALRNAGRRISARKMRFHRSKLLWDQVRHIAEVLDVHDRFGWDIQTLGTDYDGIIDTLNGFWSSEYFDHLEPYMLMHAYNYMNGDGKSLRPYNRIDPEEIIDRLFLINGHEFLRRWY